MLDLRQNAFHCDCRMEPVRQILVAMRNGSLQKDHHHYKQQEEEEEASSASSPSSFGAEERGLSNWKAFALEASQVKCKSPDSLRGQLLMTLDAEDLGCHDREWLLILIASCLILLVAVLLGVFCCCKSRRRRARSAGNPSPSFSCCCCFANRGKSKRASRTDIHRKGLKGFSSNPIYDLESGFTKADFVLLDKQQQHLDFDKQLTQSSLYQHQQRQHEKHRNEYAESCGGGVGSSIPKREEQELFLKPRKAIPSTDL